MLDATVVAISICGEFSSRRVTAGAIPITGTSVAIAADAVEQKGQRCELLFPALRSAQKWNCASRNTRASKTAPIALFLVTTIG